MTDGADSSEMQALVDRDGRFVHVGARLLALQLAAGGLEDGEVAIPQIAAVARMARSLEAPVSRALLAADGDELVDLVAHAVPEGEVVRITVSEWRAHLDDGDIGSPEREAAFADLEADISWRCNARLIVTDASPSLSRLSGTDPIGRRLQEVFHLMEDAQGKFPLIDALVESIPFSGQEAEIRGAEGMRIVLHGIPKSDGAGQPSGYTGGGRLADRALAHRNRSRAPADIVADNDFPKRLDAAIRNPLARVIAHADAIGGRMEGPLRHDYALYANDISAAGRHLLRLADDLSDLQAIERPDFTIKTDTVDLADIARRAGGLLAVRALDNGVRIDAPAIGEKLPARGDFGRALQILVNIIGNAVRYSPQGSMIWVRPEIQDDLAAIIVADQGKGIAIEDQARIFEKFQRVDVSEPNGSGLGLYISRKLARAMGGDITVQSAPGQGARFIFTLPAAASEAN